MRTHTHTYTVLPISAAAYKEIRDKLDAAGYQSQFHSPSISGEAKEVIDMSGIAVSSEDSPDGGEEQVVINTPGGSEHKLVLNPQRGAGQAEHTKTTYRCFACEWTMTAPASEPPITHCAQCGSADLSRTYS